MSDDALIGYISEISPIKLSRNEKTRYFTGFLQVSKEEKKRLICFSPDKHAVLKGAESSSQVIQLDKAILSPTSQGDTEVKITRVTQIKACMKKLPFSKNYTQLVEQQEQVECLSVKLEDVSEEYQMVSVNVKFLGMLETREVNTKYGKTTISIGVVADDSAVRKLVLWSAPLCKKLTSGSFYAITFVQNRVYDNSHQLNTTQKTTITPITEFENVQTDLEFLQKKTTTVHIISAQASAHGHCAVCHKEIPIPEKAQITIKCTACSFKQLAGNVEKSVTLNVVMQHESEDPKKTVIQSDALKEYLADINKLSLMNDMDALEDFMLMQGEFAVSMDKNGVIVSQIKNSE